MMLINANQDEIKRGICLRKGFITIGALIFLTSLIMLPLSIVYVTQSSAQGTVITKSQKPQGEESEVNNLVIDGLQWRSMTGILKVNKGKLSPKDEKEFKRMEKESENSFMKAFEHYFRDGCKKALQGKWAFQGYGDVVTIEYDETHKVFFGFVTRIVKMKEIKLGHLLFKVYFPKVQYRDFPEDISREWLGEVHKCGTWFFTGTEYSYDVKTQKDTVTDLRLTITGNVLAYQAGKGKPFYLDRLQ